MILMVLPDTHPKLRRVANPANPELGHHRTLARRLMETMNSHRAYGIAANQVHPGELVRIIAVNTSVYKGVMFNPEILPSAEPVGTSELREGCLSVEDSRLIARPWKVRVRFTTMAKEQVEMEFSNGLDAHIVQHEIDHLDGKLITDYPDESKRNEEKMGEGS